MQPPDPEDIEGVRDFIQNILGDEYEVQMPMVVEDTHDHTLLGLVVSKSDGTMLNAREVYQLFTEKGIEVGVGLPPDADKVPDTVPDELVGALDPSALNDEYGPKAGAFVDQLGRLLNLEWEETYTVMSDIIAHFKQIDLPEDVSTHLGSVICQLTHVACRNRMYLGALLQSYASVHDLDADSMEVLLKTATQRVMEVVYDHDGTEEAGGEVIKNLRKAYLGKDELMYSWPPINATLFKQLWDVVPPTD